MQSVKLPTISRSQTRPVWLPDSQQLSELPAANSTFRADFVRHSLPPMPDLRPKIGAYVSTVPFAATSEHRAAYQGDPLARKRVRVRRGQLAVSTDPFASVSIYKQEFVTKQRESPENFKPKDDAATSTAPFNASSVYKLDFPRHEQNPTLQETLTRAAEASSIQKQYSANNSKLRTLDGVTDYTGNFLDPETQGRRVYPPGYKPPTEPMSTQTSYTQEYVQFNEAKPAPMLKPDAHAFVSGAPFVGESMYKADFVPKPVRKSSANILQNRSGIMSKAVREEPGMQGVPIETFPENLSGVMFRT